MSLRNEWYALCKRWGAPPEAVKERERLFAAYQEGHRAYHTLDHIRACLEEGLRCRHCMQEPLLIETAL